MLIAMSAKVNVADFKNRFSEIIASVEAGKGIVVCRRNVPVARLEPVRRPVSKKAAKRVVGCMKGTVTILSDLTEPGIPESDWEMLK
jgi:prevent-host-death family protein